MKLAEGILLALLTLAFIAWAAGCASPNDCRVTIDPDFGKGTINYYWPGEPGVPSDNAMTLDCRARRSLPLESPQ